MGLEPTDEQAFLSEPRVAVLAVDEAGRPPLAVPLWYGYEPGGDAWILTPDDSVKAHLLRAAGTCTLVVDTVAPRTRYVSVDCVVVDERAAHPDDARLLAERYLPADKVSDYLAFATEQIGAEVVFVLRPRRWRSADLTMA